MIGTFEPDGPSVGIFWMVETAARAIFTTRAIVRRAVQNDGIFSSPPVVQREVKGARLGVFEISAFFFSETHKPC
jgi:hypothetical protein